MQTREALCLHRADPGMSSFHGSIVQRVEIGSRDHGDRLCARARQPGAAAAAVGLGIGAVGGIKAVEHPQVHPQPVAGLTVVQVWLPYSQQARLNRQIEIVVGIPGIRVRFVASGDVAF